MRAFTPMSARRDCFTRYSALTSMLGLKSAAPKKGMRPACHAPESERVRPAIGAQVAAERETVEGIVGGTATERRAPRLTVVARPRHVQRPSELDVRFRRAKPDLVADVHRDAVEPEMLHESAGRLRHQRAVAHVGRIEQLGEQ